MCTLKILRFGNIKLYSYKGGRVWPKFIKADANVWKLFFIFFCAAAEKARVFILRIFFRLVWERLEPTRVENLTIRVLSLSYTQLSNYSEKHLLRTNTLAFGNRHLKLILYNFLGYFINFFHKSNIYFNKLRWPSLQSITSL